MDNEHGPLAISIHRKTPMSKFAIERWGIKQRRYLHRFTYPKIEHYKDFPIEIIASDELLGKFMCQRFSSGDILYIFKYGWSLTITHVAQLHLCTITILDAEKEKYTINKIVKSKKGRHINRLDRQWFRRKPKF